MSEVTDEGKVYACAAKDGPALEKLMDSLREEFSANPPVRQNSILLSKIHKVCFTPSYNYLILGTELYSLFIRYWPYNKKVPYLPPQRVFTEIL